MDTNEVQELSAVARELNANAQELKDAWDDYSAREDRINARLDELDVRMQKSNMRADLGHRATEATKKSGKLLGLETKVAPRLLERIDTGSLGYEPEKVRMGALVGAIAFGEKFRGELNDDESKALLEMSGPGGGYTVPEAIASIFIDAVRPATRVLQAGAVTYPMLAPIEHIPGWDEPLQSGWRGEGGAWFVDTDPHFRRITLQAKSVATAIDLGIELVEDAGQNVSSLSQRVETEMGKALAQAIDLAALHGAGSDDEPAGLYTLLDANIGVNSVELGSGDGATPTDYDFLSDAIYEIEADNFEPSGLIWNPRTQNTLRKLVTGIAGDKRRLTVPDEVQALTRLSTNQVRNDLAVGASSDCSAAFVGDWSRLVVGVRPSMGVRTLSDPYTQMSGGKIRLYAWIRADIAVLNGPAFCVAKGIRP
jgi:HK97 family phage major capsid protein